MSGCHVQPLKARGETLGAVILAGGLARRMGGVDKGLIDLAGKPMVAYVLATVRSLVDRCVINANRNLEPYAALGVPVVPDSLPGHLGPLAGLSAGLEALATDYVLMCPCDSPFIESTLIEELVLACMDEEVDVAVAHDGQRLQPVFCAVRRRVKPSLDEFLASGERKIDKWFATQAVRQVPCERFNISFRNINTEQERLAAEQVVSG